MENNTTIEPAEVQQLIDQNTALQTQLDELNHANRDLLNTLQTRVRSDGIEKAFAESGARESLLLSTMALAEKSIVRDGEVVAAVSVSAAGKSTFRDLETGEILDNSTGAFGYKDWLNHLSRKHGVPLFEGVPVEKEKPKENVEPVPEHMQNKTKRSMTFEEKRAFKQRYGVSAYDRLPLGA